MQIGIVGLPFSGKSTLFQSITRKRLDPVLLARAEAHQAVVRVPDARVERLAAICKPEGIVFATIEFVDVVGLKRGESGTAQFSSTFLSNVKTNDALVQVVRVFAGEMVPHPDGSVDPMRDLGTFETEFLLSDLSVIETRLDRIRKQIQKSGNDQGKKEIPVLEKCHSLLESGRPLREADLGQEELRMVRTYQLLSIKPMLIALNCDETQHGITQGLVRKVSEEKGRKNTKALAFFGRIDMEIAELGDEEAMAFMAEYGIRESALDTLIREAYALLGLQSFFTVGEDECRAWTIRRGMTAQEAAGVIHSDFYDKFIRAEVVHFDDFVAHGGSFPRVKEAGLWRLEGKEYRVKDGDIISIRHG